MFSFSSFIFSLLLLFFTFLRYTYSNNNKKMLFHKNRNKQIQVDAIRKHLELEANKLVKHVVSYIGKKLAENRRSCHRVIN